MTVRALAIALVLLLALGTTTLRAQPPPAAPRSGAPAALTLGPEAEDPGPLRPIAFIAAAVLGVTALVAGLAWWGGISSDIAHCRSEMPICSDLASLESDRDLAIGVTVGLSVLAVASLVIGLLAAGDPDAPPEPF